MAFNIHLHFSNIRHSPISLGESISDAFQSNASQVMEYLLETLEINRALIAALNKEWFSDAEIFDAVQTLISEQKELEYRVSQSLNR